MSGFLPRSLARRFCKQGGTYTASACKKFLDRTTTIASQAKYSWEAREDGGLKCTIGVKHPVDPALYVKARAGTEGISFAVKKSFLAGKLILKVATHLNYNEWRRPKFGVVFSFQS